MRRFGSQMTISASAPGVREPLRGYKPKIFAGLVLVNATNWFGVSLPERTAYVHKIGRRSPTPGNPFGILVKSSLPSSLPGMAIDLPSYAIGLLPSKKNGQWSVPMVCNVPSDKPCHKRVLSAGVRKGGEHTHFAPSSRFSKYIEKNRYCGQVSPITCNP